MSRCDGAHGMRCEVFPIDSALFVSSRPSNGRVVVCQHIRGSAPPCRGSALGPDYGTELAGLGPSARLSPFHHGLALQCVEPCARLTGIRYVILVNPAVANAMRRARHSTGSRR